MIRRESYKYIPSFHRQAKTGLGAMVPWTPGVQMSCAHLPMINGLV